MMPLLLVAVAALTGTLAALLVDAWRARAARLDADLAELGALVDIEREQRHRAGGHVRHSSRGPCLLCGHKDGFK